ncbi:MAG: ATP-binding cassette domain-containing protein [Aliidongia sp.]
MQRACLASPTKCKLAASPRLRRLPLSALTLDRVTKRFAEFAAVTELSFDVPDGAIFGFLGPNGAGKTTTLRMVLDLLQPDSGRIMIAGQPPGRAALTGIGYLPEERGLYQRMSAIDVVSYFGTLKGLRQPAARAEAATLLDRVGLGAARSQPIDRLSKGMAQKVQLATALINRPKLLLLDEPFSGLDPVNQHVLEEIILERARDGATVLFSTHVMQHAERMCHRLVLMARGRKLFDGTPIEARRALPRHLHLSSRQDPSGLPGVVVAIAGAETDGWTSWQLTLTEDANPQSLLEACFARGMILREFALHDPSLHEVFRYLVGCDPESIVP